MNLGQTISKVPTCFPGGTRRCRQHFDVSCYTVGTFGIGDFAQSMLILRAAQLMGSSAKAMSVAVGLYVVHNIAHAIFDYPIGVAGDHYQRRYLLAAWYVVDVFAAVGFALGPTGLPSLVVLFILEGR